MWNKFQIIQEVEKVHNLILLSIYKICKNKYPGMIFDHCQIRCKKFIN